MAGYADFIVVGEVIDQEVVEEPYTVYEVRVVDLLKGVTPSRIRVSQLGFVGDDGVAAVTEYQPLLQVGETYVLPLSTPADPSNEVLDLLSGPLAAQEAGTQAEAALRRAGTGTWPTELVPGSQALSDESAREWSQLLNGYRPEGAAPQRWSCSGPICRTEP